MFLFCFLLFVSYSPTLINPLNVSSFIVFALGEITLKIPVSYFLEYLANTWFYLIFDHYHSYPNDKYPCHLHRPLIISTMTSGEKATVDSFWMRYKIFKSSVPMSSHLCLSKRRAYSRKMIYTGSLIFLL